MNPPILLPDPALRVRRRLTVCLLLAASAATATTAPVAPEVVERLSLPAGTAPDWEAVDDGGVWVELREEPGSDAKRGLAAVLVEAAPESVFAVVTDNATFAEFMPRVLESSVRTGADGSLLNRQVISVPLIADRHYTIRVENRIDGDGALRTWTSAWSYVEGSGNIVDTRGSWTVVRWDDSRTLVVYDVLTDPGGSIPRFLKNLATKLTLPDLLESVRERVARIPRPTGR